MRGLLTDMVQSMLSVRLIERQIFLAVVVATVIDMVDDLFGSQHAPEHLCHDESVFQGVATSVGHRMGLADPHANVAGNVFDATTGRTFSDSTSLADAVALSGTVKSPALNQFIPLTKETLFADRTGERDRRKHRHILNILAPYHSQSGVTSQMWTADELAAATAFFKEIR